MAILPLGEGVADWVVRHGGATPLRRRGNGSRAFWKCNWRFEPAPECYERVWHPVHGALRDHKPYLVVLVELPDADGVRLVGNQWALPSWR
jgi:hypothetical protein